MTRLYQGSRRNRILSPYGGLFLGAEAEGGAQTLTEPYVDNLEADTIGDTAAELAAKDIHYALGGAAGACRADDYSNMPAIANGVSYTNVFAGAGNQNCYLQMTLPSGQGYGYVPSANPVVLHESVVYMHGIGHQIDCYLQGTNNTGIFILFTGSQFQVHTRLGGAFTHKGTWASGLASTPANNAWFYLGIQYNHSTNNVYCRIKELGAGATEDTGWKIQAVAAPTFDDTEWVQFSANAKSGDTNVCGVAQLRVCEQTVHGYGNGANATRNYYDLVS